MNAFHGDADKIIRLCGFGGDELVFAIGERQATAGRFLWQLIILRSPAVDDVQNNKPFGEQLSEAIIAAQQLRTKVRTNLLDARSKFADISASFLLTIVIGRRGNLSQLERQEIQRRSELIPQTAIRTYDFLIDAADGEETPR